MSKYWKYIWLFSKNIGYLNKTNTKTMAKPIKKQILHHFVEKLRLGYFPAQSVRDKCYWTFTSIHKLGLTNC